MQYPTTLLPFISSFNEYVRQVWFIYLGIAKFIGVCKTMPFLAIWNIKKNSIYLGFDKNFCLKTTSPTLFIINPYVWQIYLPW